LKQFLWLSCHIEVFPNRQHSCRCFLQITWLLTGNRGRPLPNPPAQRCASRPSGDRCRERLPCCRETRTRHCRTGSSAVAILALPTREVALMRLPYYRQDVGTCRAGRSPRQSLLPLMG
jgi:hypothetical protein